MKIKKSLFLVIVTIFLFHSMSSIFLILAQRKNTDPVDMEKYLSTAKIVFVTMEENMGRTEPWIVLLDDGKKPRKGFFRHRDWARPHPIPDSYKYELAAYKLNKIMGINLVPATVDREIEGVSGSLQMFLGDFEQLSTYKQKKLNFLDNDAIRESMSDIHVFENLTYGECGKNEDIWEDIWIHKISGKMYRSDFSEAVSPENNLLPECPITHCSDKMYQKLMELNNSEVRTTLKLYLNDQEIEALIARKSLIIEKIRNLRGTSKS